VRNCHASKQAAVAANVAYRLMPGSFGIRSSRKRRVSAGGSSNVHFRADRESSAGIE
jgi:hypothetical protein